MSNASDFIIENGVLKKYVGPGGDVVIPEGVTSIARFAFSKCEDLQSVHIPEGVQSIGRYAFMDCNNLAVIDLTFCTPNMEEDVFFGLAEYTAIIAPQIPLNTFQSADVKRSATLGFLSVPEKYTDINIRDAYSQYALAQRKKLLPVILSRDIINGLVFYAANLKITAKNLEAEYVEPAAKANAVQCTALLVEWSKSNLSGKGKETSIASALEKDPYNTSDMKKLWSYESMEDGSLVLLSYKGSETEVYIPERIGKKSVAHLGEFIFSAKTYDGRNKPRKQAAALCAIRSVHIPDGVISIGSGAFYGCSKLKEVNIPKSIVNIGDEAFSGCKGLKDQNGYVVVQDTVYSYYGSGDTVIIPNGITKVGVSAFEKRSDITEVVIPEGVTVIEKYAFDWCTAIVKVTVPESLTRIERYAFLRCDALSDIWIPGNVAVIEKDAFMGCKELVIHAPAGSYAETYAKENNIPFMAE